MRSRLPLGALLLLAACMACEKSAAPVPLGQRSRQALPAPAPAGDMASAADLAFMREPLDTTITLGAWLASHPGAISGDAEPVVSDQLEHCRSATDSINLIGRRFSRVALFDVPEPPPGELLPATSELERSCLLHAVSLVSTNDDDASTRALASTLRAMMGASAGAGGGRPDWSPASDWDDVDSWPVSGGVVLVGLPAAQRAPAGRPRPVVVASISTAWRSAQPTLLDNTMAADRDAALTLEDSLLASAGDATLEATLRPVLDEVRRVGNDHPPHSPASDTLLLRAAREVAATAGSDSPSRRAARYAATDFAIASSITWLSTREAATDSLRRAFASSGVTFGETERTGGVEPSREWLWKAVRLDSLGRTGETTLTWLLATGWNPGPGCSAQSGAEPVIAHGEAALARGLKSPLIEYYVGLAWSDAATLANLRGGDGHLGPVPGITATVARARAIPRLRTALEGLTDRRHRREAWRIAALLMLGRSAGVHFDCFSD